VCGPLRILLHNPSPLATTPYPLIYATLVLVCQPLRILLHDPSPLATTSTPHLCNISSPLVNLSIFNCKYMHRTCAAIDCPYRCVFLFGNCLSLKKRERIKCSGFSSFSFFTFSELYWQNAVSCNISCCSMHFFPPVYWQRTYHMICK